MVVEHEAELEDRQEDEQEHRHDVGDLDECLAALADACAPTEPTAAHRIGSIRMTFDQVMSTTPVVQFGRALQLPNMLRSRPAIGVWYM